MRTSDTDLRIVVADDDVDDAQMIRDAFAECGLSERECTFTFVEDGEQLLSALREHVRTRQPGGGERQLVLLDLNMPRMDGREALKAMKSSPDLRRIPVVVLTTSSGEEDVVRTYDLGVNSYITKPSRYADLVDIAKGIARYWFELVKLPRPGGAV